MGFARPRARKPGWMETVQETFEGYSETEKPLGSYAAFMAVYGAALAGALAAARASGRPAPRFSLGDLALFGGATHKLSRLLAKSKVAAPVRAPFTEYEGRSGPAEVEEHPRGEGARRALGELLLCPYCLDQWIGGAFVAGSLFAPKTTRVVAGLFATVGVADFLQIAYRLGQQRLED